LRDLAAGVLRDRLVDLAGRSLRVCLERCLADPAS
jgi:hypothetical protein